MNEQVYIGKRAHSRVAFPPLSVSCHIRCLTPQSTLTQSHNSLNGEYEPDRGQSPTVVLPEVKVIDPSGVMPAGVVNTRLSNDSLEWLLDDVSIGSKWTAGTDFDIVATANDTRGALKIYRNIASSEKHSLRFKGKFLDPRTGNVYKVESDIVALSCTEKGNDSMKCTVDNGNIVYDPFRDKLLLYEYRQGIGVSNGDLTESAAIADGKSWKQTVHVNLTLGLKVCESLPSDLTMRLVRLGSATALTANTAKTPEILSIEWNKIVFDCRLIEKNEYEVQYLNKGKIMTKASIAISRKVSMPTNASYVHNADITPSFKVYYDSIIMNVGNAVVEHPQLYWLIQWKTLARVYDSISGLWSDGAEKQWQIGERMAVDIANLGIGMTVNDGFFSKWVEVSPHEACQLLTDDDGSVLLDDDGATMLID